jgi:hypothetical protein
MQLTMSVYIFGLAVVAAYGPRRPIRPPSVLIGGLLL